MTHLSVNLNKMALIRNSRGIDVPNLERMAERCLTAGAYGVTIHPRPDQRHARYGDVYTLKEVVDRYPGTELNIEGNPIPAFLEHVIQAKPHQCTLVPDSPDQLTSDHGWSVFSNRERLRDVLGQLKRAGIRASLFMDVENTEEFSLIKELGGDRVELYTEPYAQAFGTPQQEEVLRQYVDAASAAMAAGLEVNAGHDLDLLNVGPLCQNAEILEVSIGHALTVECFDYGLEGTIQRYLDILKS